MSAEILSALISRLIETNDVQYLKSIFHVHTDLVNSPNKHGLYPIQLCGRFGDVNMAIMLVELGGQINTQNELGLTALHYCCLYKNPNVAKYLISIGCDVNLVDSREGNTALHFACEVGCEDSAKSLIRADISLLFATNLLCKQPISLIKLPILQYQLLIFAEDSLTQIRLAEATTVRISGARGIFAECVNGTYDPLGNLYSYWPVYTKRRQYSPQINDKTSSALGASDFFMYYSRRTNSWVISSSLPVLHNNDSRDSMSNSSNDEYDIFVNPLQKSSAAGPSSHRGSGSARGGRAATCVGRLKCGARGPLLPHHTQQALPNATNLGLSTDQLQALGYLGKQASSERSSPASRSSDEPHTTDKAGEGEGAVWEQLMGYGLLGMWAMYERQPSCVVTSASWLSLAAQSGDCLSDSEASISLSSCQGQVEVDDIAKKDGLLTADVRPSSLGSNKADKNSSAEDSRNSSSSSSSCSCALQTSPMKSLQSSSSFSSSSVTPPHHCHGSSPWRPAASSATSSPVTSSTSTSNASPSPSRLKRSPKKQQAAMDKMRATIAELDLRERAQDEVLRHREQQLIQKDNSQSVAWLQAVIF